MAKFVRAAQLIRQFKQSATPTVAQGLTVDDIWVDIDDHTTWVCTAITPVTFQSLGSAVTGNIPTGVALAPYIRIVKTVTAVSTSEEACCDYMFYQKQFSTPR